MAFLRFTGRPGAEKIPGRKGVYEYLILMRLTEWQRNGIGEGEKARSSLRMGLWEEVCPDYSTIFYH